MTILVAANRGSVRSRAQTSSPLMSGSWTSRKIRSGRMTSACASAVSPSNASITVMRSSSSVRRMRSTTCGSSSAIKIVSMTTFQRKRDASADREGWRGFQREADARAPSGVGVAPTQLGSRRTTSPRRCPSCSGAGRTCINRRPGREGLRVALALEQDRGTLLALREGDLVRRVVAIGPRYGLTGADRELGRPERESGDADIVGAGLHRDGTARRLPGEPGRRDPEVLLGVWRVALEARLVVRLVVELLIGGEGRVLPLSVPDVVRILGAPAGPLLHDRDADRVAFDEPAVGVLDRVAGGVDLRLVLNEGQDRAARDGLALTWSL